MFEDHIRVRYRTLEGIVHIAERGGEDHVIPLTGILVHDPGTVRTLFDTLDIGGLDGVAQLLLHIESSLIVHIGPAEIPGRADIYERYLERITCRWSLFGNWNLLNNRSFFLIFCTPDKDHRTGDRKQNEH